MYNTTCSSIWAYRRGKNGRCQALGLPWQYPVGLMMHWRKGGHGGVWAAGLGHHIVRSDRIARAAAVPSLQTLAGHLLQVRDEVLPVRPLLLLGVIVDRPAVVEPVRHVIPVGGDHRVLYFGKMIQQLEIETAAGANLVLVQHLQHPPEANAVAVVHARVVRDIGLHRPVLRQILEKLHVRRDPKRDARIAGPSDDGPFDNRCVVEPAGCESHAVLSIRLKAVHSTTSPVLPILLAS